MSLKVLVVMEASTVTGPVKNLLQFARWARDEGSPRVNFRIATYLRGDSQTNAFIEAARVDGFEVSVIPESKRFDPAVIAGLKGLTAEFSPDVLQTHNVKTNFLVRLSGLWKRQPWLAFHHGYTATNRKDELFNLLNRWSLRQASHVVTVCEPFRQHILGIGVPPDRVTVLHNTVKPFAPLSADERSRVRASLGIGQDARMLVTVGRLSFEKGHRDLIRSFAEIVRQEPRARLVIVGEGPERPEMEAEAARLGVVDQLRLPGHQPNVAPYYGAADFFVLPSHSEGSPNALLEAMAAGLPCVATSVGGVPEIATDGETALLVPARDEQVFARAAVRLLHDDELAARLGRAGQDVVLREHTFPTYGAALMGIYRTLAGVAVESPR